MVDFLRITRDHDDSLRIAMRARSVLLRDPYATMRAQEPLDNSQTRRVVLQVAELDEAEHLELGVARATQ